MFQQCLAADLWIEELPSVISPNKQSASVSEENRFRWGGGQGAECIRQAFSDCFIELRTENVLDPFGPSGFLEVFGDNDSTVQYFVRNNSVIGGSGGWSLLPSTKILWLGADSKLAFGSFFSRRNRHEKSSKIVANDNMNESSVTSGIYTNFTVSETVFALPGSLLAIATEKMSGRIAKSMPVARASVLSTCNPFSASRGDLSSKNWNHVLRRGFCAPTVFIPGFSRCAGAFITDALVSHPNILPQLYNSGVHDISSLSHTSWLSTGNQRKSVLSATSNVHCYLTQASSVLSLLSNKGYMTQLLAAEKHGTSVLPAIGPGQFEYSDIWRDEMSPAESNDLRKYCFPVVEASEPFLTIHTDSSYAVEYSMPYAIREDNPRAKIIFIIRDPIDRIYSHYKHFYSVAAAHYPAGLRNSEIDSWTQRLIPRFDVLMEMATSELGPLGKLRHLFMKQEETQETVIIKNIVTEYYSVVNRTKFLYQMSIEQSCSLIRRSHFHWSIPAEGNITDYIDYISDSDTGIIDRDSFRWLETAVSADLYTVLKGSEMADIRCPLFTAFLAMGYELQLHSTYLPPILHYGDVIGMENILVINSDDLDPKNERRFQRIMKAIYLFLGVPAADVTSTGFVKEDQAERSVPSTHKMSRQAHHRLKLYFSIYIEHLEQATALNLSSWQQNMPPRDATLQNALLSERDLRLSRVGTVQIGRNTNRVESNNSDTDTNLLGTPWYNDKYIVPEIAETHQSGFKLLWWLAGLRSKRPSSGNSPATEIEDAPESVVGYLDQGEGWTKHMGDIIEAFLPKGYV